MQKSFLIFILAITWFCSCGQKSKSNTAKFSVDSKIIDSIKSDSSQRLPIQNIKKYIYTDTTYTASTGKGITIQNSFPKGGMIAPDGTQYIDPSGKKYAFAVFWTRIINETTTPFELNINFSDDEFSIFTPPGSYLRLLLPTDTLTFDKLSSFNYGLTGLKPYLDATINKASVLQKTINPNEEHTFYIATLCYQAGGTPRAALILKEENLYYSMSIAPNGSGTISCGKITFKKE